MKLVTSEKTIKDQENRDYKETLKIFNFIHPCLTCKKAITTLYIYKKKLKNSSNIE
jgi:hypothetical protein